MGAQAAVMGARPPPPPPVETHCVGLIGPIATVAAMLLLFCLVTSRTQKAFQIPLSTWPVY